MSSEPVLTVTGVGKAFLLFDSPAARLTHALSGGRFAAPRRHVALENVSFSLGRGETLGIMGRNGAGKTTLLHLLAGTLHPTSGTIARPPRVGTLIALGAGFDPELTGRKNLREWGALLQDGPFTNHELDEIADFTELGEALDRPLRTYSQGMQLRLGFAAATARRPDLLIIDEVLAVGDFFFRSACHARIRDFIAAGTAAVLVSHDYTEILQFSRTALLLEAGRVAHYGATKNVVQNYLHSQSPKEPDAAFSQAMVAAVGERSSGLRWPERHEQLDAASLVQSGEGVVLKRLSVTNEHLRQQRVFEQGSSIHVMARVEATRSHAVPVMTLLISDEHGTQIHGTSTYMRGDQTPDLLESGMCFEACFSVTLSLRYAEYSLELIFGDVDRNVFLARHTLTFEQLGAALRRRSVWPLGVLAVVPRQGGSPTQLTHHGLCDLPGTTKAAVMHGRDKEA